jgi:hypothetical protein
MVLLIQSSQLNPHLLFRQGRFNGLHERIGNIGLVLRLRHWKFLFGGLHRRQSYLLFIAHSIEDMDGPHSFIRTAGGKHAMFKQTIYFVQKTCCQIDYIYLIFSVRIQTS